MKVHCPIRHRDAGDPDEKPAMKTFDFRRCSFLLDRLTIITLCAAAIAAFGAVRLAAQEPSPTPAPAAAAEPKERSTGLPKGFDWTFNFDAGAGYFGFGHSLYANVRPDPSGDLSAN